MRGVLQTVSKAQVSVDGNVVGAIGAGLLLYLGIGVNDNEDSLKRFARRVAVMRIFPNEEGKFHYSILDTGGELLVIPQFTLYGDPLKGRRPEFFGAMPPGGANALFAKSLQIFEDLGVKNVASGVFQAKMQVTSSNEGPVTIFWEES